MATLSSSYIGFTLPIFAAHPGFTMLGGFACSLVGLLSALFMKPKKIIEYEDGKPIYRTKNSVARLGLFGLGIFGLGISAAPMLGIASCLNPAIIPTAVAVSLGIFCGASMVAYSMPK